MARTKKHFRPPSPASDGSSSSSEEEEEEDTHHAHAAMRGRGKHFGGKQLGSMGMKQLRATSEVASEDSSEESSDDDDDDASPQLRVRMGKQLRAPSPVARKDSESSASVHKPVQRSGGKMFGGKMMRQPEPTLEEDDSSSSSDDDDAPWSQPAARGQGKQLRPTPEQQEKKEESDMEQSSDEEVVTKPVAKKPEPVKETAKPKPAAKKAPAKKKPAAKKKKAAPKKKQPVFESSDEESEFDEEEDESEEEEYTPQPTKRRGRPARAAATKAAKSTAAAAKKDLSDSDTSEYESSSEEEEMDLDMETFDNNRLIKDEEDRKMLNKMSELDREAIFADRFEQLKKEADMKKAQKEVRRREREQKKASSKKTTKKRGASKAKAKPAPKKKKAKKDDDDMDTAGDAELAAEMAGKRRSARNLKKESKEIRKKKALNAIKERRASAKHAAPEEQSDSDDDYGGGDSDDDSDYDEGKPSMWQKLSKQQKKSQVDDISDDEGEDEEENRRDGIERRTEDADAELEDYHKVYIPRRRLMKLCNEPYFENAITNFYVRLGVGRDSKTQKPCYRLCKIVEVVTRDEYSFPQVENQPRVKTDKHLLLAFGQHTREYKMVQVSEKRPTAEDVKNLVGQLKTNRMNDEMLTKKGAAKLRKQHHNLVNNYVYTTEDIDRAVAEGKKLGKVSVNIAAEKTRVEIQVKGAEAAVADAKGRLQDAEVERMEADDAVVAMAEQKVEKAKEAVKEAEKRLQESIEEQNRLAKMDEQRMRKIKGSKKNQDWVKVNQRAKLANRNADFEAFKKEQLARQANPAEPKFDPYARRRVKPKNLWEVGGAKKSGVGGADEATGAGSGSKEAAPIERDDSKENDKRDGAQLKDGGPQQPQKWVLPRQSSNAFTFDDDLAIGGDIVLGGLGKKKALVRKRKGISLDEYQERKKSGTL